MKKNAAECLVYSSKTVSGVSECIRNLGILC